MAVLAVTSDQVIVIGAGPAGLTAAYELDRLGRSCVVLEADETYVGGLSRTVAHDGYRFDIGGHRFLTKNEEILGLWHTFLEEGDFLQVRRLSRIYYRGKFFDYPLRGGDALRKLGGVEAARCFVSFCFATLFKKGEPVSFEDWVVKHFGRRLFRIFFESYTEKVWGMPCSEISADWAAQRIRALSLGRAIRYALTGKAWRGQIAKTLTERFEYPRLGPGMMWERVARLLGDRGVGIEMGSHVLRLRHEAGHVVEVAAARSGAIVTHPAGDVVSSMPLGALIRSLDPPAPVDVLAAADALRYRDFITVALIVEGEHLFPDNWIYVHDPGVRVGRVQNFKNWSPDMVPSPGRTCLGLEYFSSAGDELWTCSDDELVALGADELERIGLLDRAKVVEGTVVRMPRAYPVYDHSYIDHVAKIRSHLASVATNVQVCGRNGMHRYNNQDHAMMTGLIAARNIAGGRLDQWLVNDDAEYLEEVSTRAGGRLLPKRIMRSGRQ